MRFVVLLLPFPSPSFVFADGLREDHHNVRML